MNTHRTPQRLNQIVKAKSQKENEMNGIAVTFNAIDTPYTYIPFNELYAHEVFVAISIRFFFF